MTEFKKEITKTLKEVNNKIIDKLSLQKEEDKNITTDDVTLFLNVARFLNQIIDMIGENK